MTFTTDHYGISTTADHGISTSGFGGRSHSGDYGASTSGCGGVSTSGINGTSVSGDYGTSLSEDGICSSGNQGTIIIKHHDGTRYRFVVGYIGENGLKPNTKYKLNDKGKFVEARK